MTEDAPLIRAKVPAGFYIVGPVYELIITTDGTHLTCERHPDHLANCRVNGRRVKPSTYERRKRSFDFCAE